MDHPLPEPKEGRTKEPAIVEVHPQSQQQHQHHIQQSQLQPSQSPQQVQQGPPPTPPHSTPSGNNGNSEVNESLNTPSYSLSGQRPRMITSSGQIREIPEVHLHTQSQESVNQEQQQAVEQYERQQQQQQHHQQHQIVQEGATYTTYENSSTSSSNTTEVKTVQIAHGRVPEREKGPNGHMAPTQTVYLLRENDEHFYRQPHPMRYENERFQRYHPYLPPTVKAEIEVQPQGPSQPGQQIIYETESGETVVTEASQQETKAQYTNLEPMQNISSSQGYIFQPGYSSGNVTYLPSAKEEYYIQGSPNPVLYKSK